MNKKTEQRAMILAGAIGAISLLTYTFKHTGDFLARYIEPAGLGFLAAFGIEAIVVLMAWRLAKRTANGFTQFALIAALVVSALANLYEGYFTRTGETLSLSLAGYDIIEAVVLVLATAIMSLLVFALSDIVGGDLAKVVRATDRAERLEQKANESERLSRSPELDSIDWRTRAEREAERANGHPNESEREPELAERISAILIAAPVGPGGEILIGPSELSRQARCSKSTASKYIKEWEVI